MRYLVFDRDTRTVKIRNQPGHPAITQKLPSKADLRAGVRWDAWDQPWDHVSNIVLHRVIYPARYARDKARGITGKKYMLWAPEPWMIALGMVMWDGIVQGVTWDAVKLSVRAALAKLRHAGIAPPAGKTSSKTLVSTHLGFRYTEYTKDGKQREMFLGLQRYYEREVKNRLPASSRSRSAKRNP